MKLASAFVLVACILLEVATAAPALQAQAEKRFETSSAFGGDGVGAESAPRNAVFWAPPMLYPTLNRRSRETRVFRRRLCFPLP
ncbi:uncharacterized protein B0H18DRAFT_216956 [Fomitopsis serialis]|uniref:uncharacterized protein n=1 Tax=Fomitopsis serialis TaxID=139415 RepID=UPI002007942E|nr:uncharacterized protein B0H18DRAFT_216956 [Neoantrodia serialis]KAH9913108.1 hypothetical protein B0H18DRAFT_216956 [Neoantrodia serialis]